MSDLTNESRIFLPNTKSAHHYVVNEINMLSCAFVDEVLKHTFPKMLLLFQMLIFRYQLNSMLLV